MQRASEVMFCRLALGHVSVRDSCAPVILHMCMSEKKARQSWRKSTTLTGPRFGQDSNPQPKIHFLQSGDPWSLRSEKRDRGLPQVTFLISAGSNHVISCRLVTWGCFLCLLSVFTVYKAEPNISIKVFMLPVWSTYWLRILNAGHTLHCVQS